MAKKNIWLRAFPLRARTQPLLFPYQHFRRAFSAPNKHDGRVYANGGACGAVIRAARGAENNATIVAHAASLKK